MTEWHPPIDFSTFKGSEAEGHQFIEQRFARMGRDKFMKLGRGVVIVHLDDVEKTARGEYNTMDTNDGSPTAQQVRNLINTYDPERQAVIQYRNASRGIDMCRIVDIDTQH